MSAARDALSAEEVARRSARIRDAVLRVPEVSTASSFFVYVSTGNEVDTRELIRVLIRKGKTVTAPRIVGEGVMEAHRIGRLEELVPGRFGIPAPGKPDPFEGTPDVCISPGVAFGPRGERLGRGKGYYDGFLAEHPDSFAVGLCYDFQVVEEIPVTQEDRRVRLIVTESRTIRV